MARRACKIRSPRADPQAGSSVVLPAAFDPWLEFGIAAEVAGASRCTPAALERLQRHRLTELLIAARNGSPLYRSWLEGVDPATVALNELPVSRKRDLMAHFDRWVCDPALELEVLRGFIADRHRIAEPFQGRYLVWESSGSSGVPGIFVQDARAMAVNDALEALRRPLRRPWLRLLDPAFATERIVFLGAIDGHFASTVSVARLRRINPMLAPRLTSISFLQPPADTIAALERAAPTILASYPSAAQWLAGERRAGRLHIQPQEIWTGGETLTRAMRRDIEQGFDCPVVNSYGASEFLSLASECDAGSLHLNSDWALLESIDRFGRPVAAGQIGASCLLTNLANHVQPLIRYELGDRIRFAAEPCGCGSSLPVIEVQGRGDDVLHMSDASGHRLALLPLALTTVLEDEAGLSEFQLIQQGPAELLLRTVCRGAAASAGLRQGRKALEHFLASQGLPSVTIRCQSGVPSQLGRSGKSQRVVAC